MGRKLPWWRPHGTATRKQYNILLLRYGAKRNTKDEANRTALKLAQAHRQVQCEELLRAQGDSPTVTDSDSARLNDPEDRGGSNDGVEGHRW